DPLGSGLVASLARPGGNVTGMSLIVPDLGAKRLELLKELLPRLSRVAVFWNAANPYSALVYKETQAGGRTLGIDVQSLDVRGPDDFDGAVEAARRLRPVRFSGFDPSETSARVSCGSEADSRTPNKGLIRSDAMCGRLPVCKENSSRRRHPKKSLLLA